MNVKIADRVRAAVTAVATLVMVYALFVSADHISHVAHLIGLTGYQASTFFVLIDIPALVGKALRLKYFATSTRRTGLRLMIASGTLSLLCNVASGWFGGGAGPAAHGAFVVLMFLVLENVVTKIKPAAAVTRAKNAATPVTTSPAPRRATPRKRAPKPATATVRQLEQAYRLPSAPVSPA
jgi:hypothetical protein